VNGLLLAWVPPLPVADPDPDPLLPDEPEPPQPATARAATTVSIVKIVPEPILLFIPRSTCVACLIRPGHVRTALSRD
jgi:hypothetical protein